MSERGLQPKATRRSVPRVKTGCSTCKIRHVKCDEMKPACRRCTSTGRTCDGYSQPAVAAANSNFLVHFLDIPAYEIPFRIPGGQNERRLFHYFCVYGNSDLAGWIKNAFWSNMVLEYSHNEPVLRQSVIALSSAHLDRSTGRSDTQHGVGSEETLRHYLKAIRQLRKYMCNHSASRNVVLCCCLVLYAFECARDGNRLDAFRHLENGLDILDMVEHERMGNKSPRREEALELELMRGLALDLDRLRRINFSFRPGFGHREVPRILFDCEGPDPARNQFHSVQDAQNVFILVSIIAELEETGWDDVLSSNYQPQRDKHRADLKAWFVAFDDFLRGVEYGSMSQEEKQKTRRCAATLKVKVINSDIDYRSFNCGDIKAWTGPDNVQVEEMLSLSTMLVEFEESRRRSYDFSTDGAPCQTCSTEVNTMVALFTLARNTTYQEYRERATSLLERMHPRREGVYDSGAFLETLRKAKESKGSFPIGNFFSIVHEAQPVSVDL